MLLRNQGCPPFCPNCICLADAEQQNAKTQGRKEIPFGSRAWAAFGRILGRAAGESAILLSSRCPRFLPRLAQGCARAKRCAHACCSVSIFVPPRLCVSLLHPFDLATQLQGKRPIPALRFVHRLWQSGRHKTDSRQGHEKPGLLHSPDSLRDNISHPEKLWLFWACVHLQSFYLPDAIFERKKRGTFRITVKSPGRE